MVVTHFKLLRWALRKFRRGPDPPDLGHGLESPVPHLLTSNSPPSVEERNLIHAALTRASEEERSLAVRSSYVHPEDDSFENRRELSQLGQLQTFIRIHERLLSPLRSLPPELLSLIFSFCVPHAEDSSRRWDTLPAFSIVQVCRRWRTIGIDTPALWVVLPRIELTAKTAVIPGSRLKRSHQRRLAFLEETLRRSKDKLLWLDIKADDDYHRDQQPVIDILAREAYRWGGFVIYSQLVTLNSICYAQRALQQAPGPPFPRLQILGLHLVNVLLNAEISWFSQTPNLQELTISGLINPQNIDVPHTQLRLYHEECICRGSTRVTLNEVLKFSNETLESMEVFVMDRSPGPFTQPVILDKLKHLKIRSDPRISSVKLLNDLVLPSVEHFSFEQDAGSPFPHLLALIRRSVNHRQSSHPLKYLHLRVMINVPGQLKSFLRKTPQVVTLEISMPPPKDLFSLVASESRVKARKLGVVVRDLAFQIVPELKSITFYCTLQNVIGNESALLAIAHARFIHRSAVCHIHRFCTPELHQVESLRLLFDDHSNLYASLGLLNRWNTTGMASIVHESRAGTPVSSRLSTLPSSGTLHVPGGSLATWRSDLRYELPEIREFGWRGEWSRHKGKVNAAFLERIDGIFTAIENYNASPGKALNEIYMSKLHFTLRQLVGYTHFPGDRKYKFRQRAEAILTRWETLFLADISRHDSTLFWAIKGARAIVFIPGDHPLRRSDDALDLVYGLKGDGSFEEGFLEYERL
ncbi:hypothetical protein M413DRAFT_447665 [Hebeloma cylindrosporum]|uniref:F-box domain-containing protein n=1 Tax=Hebeloma cylindrosporum TaxID=76867 RepID=A0A0C2YCJ4_HEBCY|nr:hypothetical protein M413DRAFT_447665 [Hebeloma cylindrosporum h7]